MTKVRFIWDEEKTQFLRDHWNTKALHKLAAEMHAHSDTILEKTAELGLPPYKSNRWTDKEREKLRELAPTVFYKEIAVILGKTEIAVLKQANKLGIKVLYANDMNSAALWDEEKEKYLLENYDKIGITELGTTINVPYNQILKKLKEHGIEWETRNWTDDEIAILRKMAPVVHYREISKVLHRSVGAITAKAFDLNIPLLVNRRVFTDKEINYIKRNWKKKSTSQIARDLKSSIGLVNTTAKKLGLPKKGQNIKWTDAKLKKLRKLAEKMTIPELAVAFKTSTSAITSVCSKHKIRAKNARKRWKAAEKKQLKDLAPTHTVDQLVKILEKESHSIRTMSKRLGVTIMETVREDIGRSWETEDDEKFKELAKTHTAIEIAIMMDRTVGSIKARAQNLSIQLIKVRKKGWTNEQKEELRQLSTTYSVDYIVKKLHKPTHAVKHTAKMLGIELLPVNQSIERKPWTTLEEARLIELAETLDSIDIAILLDRTDNAVKIKASELGIEIVGDSKTWTEAKKKKLVELAPTHTVDQIVKELGIGDQAVQRMAKKLGVDLMKPNNGTGKPWTGEDETLLAELAHDHTSIEIANIMDRTDDAIRIRANKLGIKLKNVRRQWTTEEENELASMWGRYSIDEIAEILGRTVSSISNRSFLLKLGSVQNSNYEGLTIQEICDLFGISRSIAGITWPSIGLITEQRKISNQVSFTIVKIPNLLAFLQIHQDIWDSRTLPENILGPETIWFLEKRKADLLRGEETIKKINTRKQQLIATRKYYLEQVARLPKGIQILSEEPKQKIIK